ncbi:hypothetical protein FOFC_21364 [Fusarium oxysporum]|nr:hypothetical protein FOFC_21364 [Fusarium oxysporum]
MLVITKDNLLSVLGITMNETQETEHIHSAGSRCPCRPVQRRSHKKSRNGCQTCKKRRIKCDENKPVCKNCSHLSFTCSFDTASDAATKTTVVPIRPRQRGRPLTWASDPGISTQALVPISMDRQLLSPSQQSLPLNIDDLRLYHHYITVASLTFGDDAMWHDKIPLLAFDNHFILHLMLAVSGLHLARFQALEATKYEKLAEHHHSKALSHVTNLLPQINHQNCSALYIATVLICNYAFAKPPKKGHLLVPFDGTETAWWNLFRGVRFVIETMGLTAIFSGPIGPFPPETASSIPPPVGRAGYIAWEKPLGDLRTMIHDSQTPGLPDLQEIYEALVCCFGDVFGTADQPQEVTHGKMDIVMRWVWFLEDDFTKQVEKLNPQVLVLLAYFSVLVQTLECFWYMRGWGWRILESITEQLDPDYAAWITWPRDHWAPYIIAMELTLVLIDTRNGESSYALKIPTPLTSQSHMCLKALLSGPQRETTQQARSPIRIQPATPCRVWTCFFNPYSTVKLEKESKVSTEYA